jgi:hypothetical protein
MIMDACSCGDTLKCGLPCKHLLRLRRSFRLPYLDLVLDRWLIENLNNDEG